MFGVCFDVVEHYSLLEGAYLVFDAKNARIHRSGKASPVTISCRWYEKHTKAEKFSNLGWYGQFPHRNNPNIRDNIRKGYFDQLQLFAA